ncbi:hypothetical protein [Bradyrhizobium elkanii]|uniref:hypothetical protein n=1 Tax=Bradyrhizobium elkanii TaxID=29448 RepID=UPI000841725F|nr:hypothetical protein [Bradyrhizobium elkanii]ODM71661.1 hypothetical protein A6X20_06880 [Bradyrhizobium elkanii]ODM79033.1 hypothetical protein A6452_28465 [Bradyrhizobium elkanii]
MSKTIFAHTNLNALYPGYINFTREADGSVSVHLRGDPSVVDGVYVCGYARDKGQPSRCTPGDDRCNNYCNMAPQKGAMQEHPAACVQVICADVEKLTLSAADFEALVAGLSSPG